MSTHYMIIRRAGATGVPPAAADAWRQQMEDAGVLRASVALADSAGGARVHMQPGHAAEVAAVPGSTEGIAGFAIVEVNSREEALAWAERWPGGGACELEVRMTGCPGGCATVQAVDVPGMPEQQFAILLRSTPALEAETPVPQAALDALDAYNAIEAKAGILVAADGLRSTASGARARHAAGKVALVDGPFTEIKELIAGFWMIRAASLDDAIAWAQRLPYPTASADVTVDVLPVSAAVLRMAPYTLAQHAAEQRMRASQLEAGLHAPLAWR